MKQMQFEGTGLEFFKIWIVNIFLTIITLGIYYPWAKVRTRRYFYANTVYEGRNLEYHATGKQLFLGYLIAIVVLLIVGVLNSIFPILEAVFTLILFCFIPGLIWRSLRFNMRMTSFSNVRFSFQGSVTDAYKAHLLPYIIGLVLCFGPLALLDMGSLANPSKLAGGIALWMLWMLVTGLFMYAFIKKSTTTYFINNLQFGQGEFDTELSVTEFMSIAGKSMAIQMGLYLLLTIVAAFILGFSAAGIDLESFSRGDIGGSMIMLPIILIYFGFIFISFITFAYLNSNIREHILENTDLDTKIFFDSTVATKSYAILLFTNFLLVIFTLGLATPWTKVRIAQYMADNTWIGMESETDFDHYMSQKVAEQSAIGDQLADALDIDIDIAI